MLMLTENTGKGDIASVLQERLSKDAPGRFLFRVASELKFHVSIYRPLCLFKDSLEIRGIICTILLQTYRINITA